MRRHIGILVLGVLVLALLLVYTIAFQVSEASDVVAVTWFGRTTEVLSGRDPNQAGLHVKMIYPIQKAHRYDARTFVFEDALTEMQTSDKKSVMASLFCAWRIADAARFLAAIETVPAAEDRIRLVVGSAKQQAFTRRTLSELINTDPGKMQLASIETNIQDTVRDRLLKDYGVEIVMVGIQRLGLSEQVSETAINTMKQERLTAADEYRASGEARATAIRERARAAAEKILAFAKRKADSIRAEGAKSAADYYAKYQGHEDLAIFLQGLEMMKRTLGRQTVFLLDESSLPFVKFFRSVPTAESVHQMTTTAPSPSK
jgi:modulator of FtsH protease HflC